MATVTEDGRLVQCVREGDLEALGVLYEMYKTPIFRVALAILKDKGLAEDVLQETFLRLHSYAYTVDLHLPLLPWLYRVAVNLSYTNTRQAQRWWTSLETLVGRLIGPSHTFPEEHIEAHETQRAVWRAIDGLEADQRVTIILYYLCDLSLREISYAMDCPLGTVKSRLHYGRAYLREVLGNLAIAPARLAVGTG